EYQTSRSMLKKKLIIFGTGDNGGQVFHIIKHLPEYEVVGFLDDDKSKWGSVFCGVPVYGGSSAIQEIQRLHQITHCITAIGNNRVRSDKNKLMTGFGLELINAIHPKTLIDDTAVFGLGVIVEMGASVHPYAVIGDGVFLAGGSIVAHNSRVGEYSLIAGGVVFGGAAKVGSFSLVGVGSSLQPYVSVGSHCVIGVGSAVVRDVPDYSVAYGVPARVARKNR
ncbi:MAG TPA: acetyltransferase, partial [Candidatus Kryptobacter bacterium]|nr:acetyltransferase [Candidatus Kryptobacter bacterium]